MSGHTIRSGDQVTLHYRIASMGQEIVNTFPDAPDVFRLGVGDLEARLEQLLAGLIVGSHQTFHLTPSDAFGERDEALVYRLARNDFPAELSVGQQAEFELPNGRSWLGTLVDLDDEIATVDFNHPLAGLPIEFEVLILAIDPDTPEDHEH